MKRRFFVNQRRSVTRAQDGPRRVFGIHAVAARLATEPPLVRQLYVRDSPGSRVAALAALASRRSVAVRYVSVEALRELCGADHHQGVVADVPAFRYLEFADLLAAAPERVLVVDQLNDPHNLGALLRTAEAAGFGAVVLPQRGSVPVTPTVEKAASGAAVRLPVCLVVNLVRSLRQLREAGYWIAGLAPRSGGSLFDFESPARLVIVIGGEEGARRLVREQCDVLLSIPMEGEAESLNASVAGALAMYATRWHLRHRP
jgi:23S rRNA (guanosine2251-2'-O)-methyltransferase